MLTGGTSCVKLHLHFADSSAFKLAINPEYRFRGRSLRTAMPNTFRCPTKTNGNLSA